MQGGDIAHRVLLDYFWLDENWNPVVVCYSSCLEAIHREATGQTGNTAEYRLERFR